MAGKEREVKVTVLGDSSSGQRALSQLDDKATKTGNHFDGLGSKLASFGKVAALGLAGAAVGVGAFLKSSVEAAEESRKVMAQTDAVIKSTGGVARVTAGDVDKLANSLAGLTGIDDEAIASTSNLLLTFTNVRNEAGKGNDVFNQATKTALDMSVALGTDAKGAAIQLGKALNDPIKGVSALGEVGVTFTEQQKKQIKTLVESGDVLGAQKIILKELATEFGGSAAAAASPMARLKVVVGNLQEELGARLLPVIGKVAGFLADKLPGAIDKVTGLFSGLFNLFTKGDFTGALGKALGIEEDSPIVGTMLKIRDAIVGAVDDVVAWVKQHWPEIKKIITDTLKAVQSVVKGVVDVLVTIWENFGEQIMDVVKAAWRFVRDTIEGALRVIQGIVKVVTGIIHGDWGQVWEGIKQIVSGAWEIIKARIDLAMNLIKNIISVALEIIAAAWSGAWNGIKDFFAGIWDSIFDLARRGVANIVDAFLGMAGTIIHAADSAFGWIPSIGDKLHDARVAFDNFRDNVNAALRGIHDKTVNVTINEITFRSTVQGEQARSPGNPGGYTPERALGMELGPIPGARNQAVPIIAHGGEWVVTPEQMAKLRGGWSAGAAGGDGSGSVVLGPGSIVVYALDPKSAALGVRDELISYGKRVPGLLLDG